MRARLVHSGIDPFGAWLHSQGIPFGWVIAWAISILEMVGSIAFAAGFLALPLALSFSAIYVVGIVMVHAPAGWFVVGLGRNGMEFSVLLIVGLLCTGFASRRHVSSRRTW
jgi:putative oxidoreductase